MQACGAVSDVDMRHRLNTYIIKNPPEDKISKAEKRCVGRMSLHDVRAASACMQHTSQSSFWICGGDHAQLNALQLICGQIVLVHIVFHGIMAAT